MGDRSDLQLGSQFAPSNLLFFSLAKPSKSRLGAYLTQKTAISWTWQPKLIGAKWPPMEIKPRESQKAKIIGFISICSFTTPSSLVHEISRRLIVLMPLFILPALTHPLPAFCFGLPFLLFFQHPENISLVSPFRVVPDHLNEESSTKQGYSLCSAHLFSSKQVTFCSL